VVAGKNEDDVRGKEIAERLGSCELRRRSGGFRPEKD
jgi:hypothetical protein